MVDIVVAVGAYTASDTPDYFPLDNSLPSDNYCHNSDSCLAAVDILLVDSENIVLEDSAAAWASASVLAFALASVLVLELVLASEEVLALVVARASDSAHFLDWHNLSSDDSDWHYNQNNSTQQVVEVLGLQAVLQLAVDESDRTGLNSVDLHIDHISV